MQSTIPTTPNLLRSFACVPDPRTRRGRRYPLPTLLSIAVAAILANHTSVLAMAEWAGALSATAKRRLGLASTAAPHQTTFARLFRRIDPIALTIALSQAFQPRTPTDVPARGSIGIAIDGKTHRGRLAAAVTEGCSIHSVSLVEHVRGLILAHQPVIAAQGEAELTVVPALLGRVEWTGRVLTGDALYCQRSLCAAVVQAGGDYLVTVKANQPTLAQDIRWLFQEPILLDDRRSAQAVSKGHGRVDVRTVVASSDLAGYSDWPYLAQVFTITRTWRDSAGERHHETHYGVTSLPAEVADAAHVLRLKRGHWTIENRVHRVKDVTLGEDASLVHCDHGPAVLALLRDTVLNLVRLVGYHSVATALRSYSRNPEAALTMVGVAENA